MEKSLGVFPEGSNPKPMFKNNREWERWKEEMYRKLKPKLDEAAKRRKSSELRAKGLNPDAPFSCC